jgi:transcriptional regulator with XRE-family HTH domain
MTSRPSVASTPDGKLVRHRSSSALRSGLLRCVTSHAYKVELQVQSVERELPGIAHVGNGGGAPSGAVPSGGWGNHRQSAPVACGDGQTLNAMPSSSSSAQAARERLAAQLRMLRLTAGLSGREFADAADCQASKVSQIERAVRPASIADVRLWCRVCGASAERTAELLAEQAAAARLWSAYRDLGRHTGLNATQKLLTGDIWETVRDYRTYQTKVIPGHLQTYAYMTGIMTAVRHERNVEDDDVAEAVAERFSRQDWMRRTDRQFRFVIEEPVLWFRNFSVMVQRAQLAHLLTVMTLPSVSLGIIPMRPGRRAHRPRESFEIFDAHQVNIEMLTGLLTLTFTDEVSAYARAWDELDSIAVRQADARALIHHALSALDDIPPEGDAHQDED